MLHSPARPALAGYNFRFSRWVKCRAHIAAVCPRSLSSFGNMLPFCAKQGVVGSSHRIYRLHPRRRSLRILVECKRLVVSLARIGTAPKIVCLGNLGPRGPCCGWAWADGGSGPCAPLSVVSMDPCGSTCSQPAPDLASPAQPAKDTTQASQCPS